MDGYLIIGCGHFGSRAAKKLFQRDSNSKIIVVDKSRKALQRVSRLPIQTVVCDGISYLNQFLSEGCEVNYIIPAVPFHLAFEFILSQLNSSRAKRRKLPPLSGLPNPVLGKTSDLYTSFADFLCPEDCPEPAQYCFTTKKKRPKSLYQNLNDLQGAFESKVIRSQQLGPGIGRFRPKALWGLLEGIKKKRNSDRLILISTASRCHGVTSALSF
ncbi:MAG: NAD-binding protein [Thermodesulfobacteriota bacterium]